MLVMPPWEGIIKARRAVRAEQCLFLESVAELGDYRIVQLFQRLLSGFGWYPGRRFAVPWC